MCFCNNILQSCQTLVFSCSLTAKCQLKVIIQKSRSKLICIKSDGKKLRYFVISFDWKRHNRWEKYFRRLWVNCESFLLNRDDPHTIKGFLEFFNLEPKKWLPSVMSRKRLVSEPSTWTGKVKSIREFREKIWKFA